MSPHGSIEKKAYDAGDLRRIIRVNHDRIDRSVIPELGDQLWEQGGEELLRFLDLAMQDEPFPADSLDMPTDIEPRRLAVDPETESVHANR